MADFKTRLPGVDPQAFANVLQRKAQMEQEQLNIETERKQGRTKRLLDAVITGQNIASNMMTIAEKRNKLSQDRKEQDAQDKISSLAAQPPAVPTDEPSLDPKINQQRMEALAQERQRQLMSNIAIASSKDYNEAMLKKSFPEPDKKAAAQMHSGNIRVKVRGQKEWTDLKGTYDTLNKRLYDWTGRDITDTVDAVAPSYAPATVQDSAGGVSFEPRIPNTRATTNPESVQRAPDGTPLKSGVEQLQRLEVDRLEKLKEDFNTDKAVSAAITKQGDYQIAAGAIETGNWVGDAALLSVAAKGLGRDVGALSDIDQQRYKTSPEVIRKVKTNINKWINGVIPEEDREDFKEALRVAQEKNDEIIEKKRDIYARTAATRVKDLDPEFAKKYIYDYTPSAKKKDINAAIDDFFSNPTGE